uniref:Ovule protein n=1 Tax=Meloidogyne incognita TaxID=6306 RepID=A0A914KL01_MELIC
MHIQQNCKPDLGVWKFWRSLEENGQFSSTAFFTSIHYFQFRSTFKNANHSRAFIARESPFRSRLRIKYKSSSTTKASS